MIKRLEKKGGLRQTETVVLCLSVCGVSVCVIEWKWKRLRLRPEGVYQKRLIGREVLRVKGKAPGTDAPPHPLVTGLNLWGRY